VTTKKLPPRRQIHAGLVLRKTEPNKWVATPHPTTQLFNARLDQSMVDAMMHKLVNSKVDYIMITAYISEDGTT